METDIVPGMCNIFDSLYFFSKCTIADRYILKIFLGKK